jgi:hypothetical protein
MLTCQLFCHGGVQWGHGGEVGSQIPVLEATGGSYHNGCCRYILCVIQIGHSVIVLASWRTLMQNASSFGLAEFIGVGQWQ